MTFQSGESAFTCDSCPEHIDCDDRAFKEALEFAVSKGWRAYIGPDKKWAHSCPACVADFAREKKQ